MSRSSRSTGPTALLETLAGTLLRLGADSDIRCIVIGTQRPPAAIGRAKALDVILSGRLLTAEEADRFGLVSRVVARDAWLEEARAVAQAIASRGPFAQLLAKETVNAASDVPFAAALELERRAFTLAFGSPEARERIDAFLEKRPRRWGAPPAAPPTNTKE